MNDDYSRNGERQDPDPTMVLGETLTFEPDTRMDDLIVAVNNVAGNQVQSHAGLTKIGTGIIQQIMVQTAHTMVLQELIMMMQCPQVNGQPDRLAWGLLEGRLQQMRLDKLAQFGFQPAEVKTGEG